MMGKREIPLLGGDEYDYLTEARHYFCINRRVIIKRTKRKFNKRVRRFVKDQIKQELY